MICTARMTGYERTVHNLHFCICIYLRECTVIKMRQAKSVHNLQFAHGPYATCMRTSSACVRPARRVQPAGPYSLQAAHSPPAVGTGTFGVYSLDAGLSVRSEN